MQGEEPPVQGDVRRMTKKSLEVEPIRHENRHTGRFEHKPSLDSMSRVNFGKVYTVEHNVKVLPVGQVTRKSMELLLEYFNESLSK